MHFPQSLYKKPHNSIESVTEEMPDKTELLKIAVAVLIPIIAGVINAILTGTNIDDWYDDLNYSFRPPNWLFAPVWTVLYCGMGFASYLVYRDGGGFTGRAIFPLIAYVIQLGINIAWTPLFFIKHNIKGVTFHEIIYFYLKHE